MKLVRFLTLFAFVHALTLTTVAFAQTPNLEAFLTSPESILELGGLLAPVLLGIVTNWLTYLGKQIAPITGWTTRLVALGISLVVSLLAGYFSLGSFSEMASWAGAGQLLYLTAFTWLTSLARAAKDLKLGPGTIKVGGATVAVPSADVLLKQLDDDSIVESVKTVALNLLEFYYPPLADLGRKLFTKQPLNLQDLQRYNQATQASDLSLVQAPRAAKAGA